jgi:glutathione S-transferase
MGRADLEAISALLGDRPFFLGDRPTTIDTIAYGCLENLISVPIETELKRTAHGFPNLPAYCARMAAHLEAS